ncbi:hypothetical protein APUTEX25_001700, partial [Auxenochlorella protothecoides]
RHLRGLPRAAVGQQGPVAQAVPHQVGDGDAQQAVACGKLRQLRRAGHGPILVVVHHLRQRAGGEAARQEGQVHARLGVPGPLQHATLGVGSGGHGVEAGVTRALASGQGPGPTRPPGRG